MIRAIFFVVTLILGGWAIYCYAINKSKLASIILAILTILSLIIAIYPTILEQEKIEPDVSLDFNSLELLSSDEYTLNATTSPDDAVVEWTSSDSEIVTVDDKGHLKAISDGTATVTAKLIYKKTKYEDNCDVVVKTPEISLDAFYSLTVGETKRINASTIPKESNIIWDSSNSEIATVNDNGEIEAITEGTATVTGTMIYNNKNYSANCAITVKAQSDERDDNSAGNKANNDDADKTNIISIRDIAWLDDKKVYKDDNATTMRGETWSDCVRFGSSNINSDGISVLRVVCDQKYNKFTAEIAPQEGFDKTESVILYIYGGTGDEQTFKEEFQIDYSTKPFKVEYDLSNTDEVYFWKTGNYNQGRIAGQFLNGYTGMGVLMRDAILYEKD